MTGTQNSYSLIDLLLTITKHKKFIIVTTLIVSVLAVVFTLITDEYWVSTATILPVKENGSSYSFGSGSSLLGLGSSLLGGGLNVDGLGIVTIMQSRTFSEDVIRHFDLVDYLEIEDPDTLIVNELAMKFFREKMRKISIDEESGLISVSIETKDKHLSSDIANYHCMRIDTYNTQERMTKGKQKREFLETRIADIQSSMQKLGEEYQRFQNEHNVVDLENQTKMTVDIYSDLVSQMAAKEIELEYIGEISGTNNPSYKAAQKEVEILQGKISQLEISQLSESKYVLSLDKLPEYGLVYANLKLNMEIQEKILTYIYPEFEQAKIEEIKDSPSIEIIDKAIPSGLRSKPKRAKMCVISFIVAFILSVLYSVIMDIIEAYADSQNGKEKLQKLKYNIRRKK